ncbi:hypothetical protein Q9Q94_15690 [Uliginosibacterium sp. 31-16]|uniref:hypothetical protein n=1 Tax=Uliginosibacterium sp. 31-16 TaxID=3068315 RepID=UPI00273F5055|nr:hypothetical protein [Uliginosibacterium sp. 31-16]MDP5240984.1 hypothetical protein [Uliginosibacterium sp. 31-16]
MINSLRTLLGIRTKRQPLPITSAPRPGASIVKGDYRIKTNQPCDGELWDWLLLMGWRVSSVRNDRRGYQEMPADTITRLKAASIESRSAVLDALSAKASRQAA